MVTSPKKRAAVALALVLLLIGIGTTTYLLVGGDTPTSVDAAFAPGVDGDGDGDSTAPRTTRRRVGAQAEHAVEPAGRRADEANTASTAGDDAHDVDALVESEEGGIPSAAPAEPREPAVVRVVGHDGKPLAGAAVEVLRAPEIGWPGDYAAVLSVVTQERPVIAQAITDADGRVEYPELASAGKVHIRVSKSGHGSTTIRRHPGGGRSDIALGASHEVRGLVLIGGEPSPAGVQVMLTQGGGPPVVVARAETDAQGRFVVPSVAAGQYAISIAWPGGLPAIALGIDVPSDSEPVVRVADGGTITGVVRNATTGDPVEGVRVLALSPRAFVGQAITDRAGRYTLHLVGDGTVKRLTAWKQGMAEVAARGTPLTIGAGVERVVDLDIFAGGSVSGVVRGPDGPIAGVSVQAWTADGRYITQSITETAEDGSYTITGLRPGLAHVLVSSVNGLVHAGEPGDMRRWEALLENTLDARCSATIVDGGNARLDITMEPRPKKATAAR